MEQYTAKKLKSKLWTLAISAAFVTGTSLIKLLS